MKWQLQTAKNRFSEVVREALKGDPQLVTKNGQPAVYVVDYATYHKCIEAHDFDKKSILRARPHKDIDLDIDRNPDTGREIQL